MKIPIPLDSSLCTDSHKNEIKDPTTGSDLFSVNRTYFYDKLLSNSLKRAIPSGSFVSTSGRLLEPITNGDICQITDNGKIVASVNSLGVESRTNIFGDDAVYYNGKLYSINQTISGYDIVNITDNTTESYVQEGILQVRFVKNTITPIMILQGYSVRIGDDFINDPGLVSWFQSIQITELVAVNINGTVYFNLNGSSTDFSYSKDLGNGITWEFTGDSIKYTWNSPRDGCTFKFYYGATDNKASATVINDTALTKNGQVVSIIIPRGHWYIWLDTYTSSTLLGTLIATGQATAANTNWKTTEANRRASFTGIPNGTIFCIAAADVTMNYGSATLSFTIFDIPCTITPNTNTGALTVPYIVTYYGSSERTFGIANRITVSCYSSIGESLSQSIGPLQTVYEYRLDAIWSFSSGVLGNIPGRMLAPYCYNGINTWVVANIPKKNGAATFGDAEEWQCLYDLSTGSFIPGPKKTLEPWNQGEIIDSRIAWFFIGMGYVSYVICYLSDNGSTLWFKDVNYDSVFTSFDYSSYGGISPPERSILGNIPEEVSLVDFNGSIMVAPNIRLNYLKNIPQTVSWAENPGVIGVLLSAYGEIEDYAPVQVTDEMIIYKTTGGYIALKLGTAIEERITKIANYIYQINTVSHLNILIESEEVGISAEYGSLDWNNKIELVPRSRNFSGHDRTYYRINTAYNANYEITGKRSTSYIGSNMSLGIHGEIDLFQTGSGFYSVTPINSGNIPIDIYYGTGSDADYKYTIIGGLIKQEYSLEEASFPLGVTVPYPIGLEWDQNNEIYAVSKTSISTTAIGLIWENRTVAAYMYDKNIYYGKNIFLLYGVMYIFDGDDIYILDTMERICHAFGYLFLGVDQKMAYFYSSFDKSIYTFSGSRDMSFLVSMSNREEVINSIYDTFSDELFMLTKNEILIVRKRIISNFINKGYKKFFRTTSGTWTYGEAGGELLSPRTGDVDPFELVTEFIGVDGSTVCDYERVDIRFYSPEKKPISFIAGLQTINQDTKESENKMITIKGNDWSQDGCKTVKLIPQYKKGTGLSLRIYSEGLMRIAGIEFTYNPVARTANSQRSGY